MVNRDTKARVCYFRPNLLGGSMDYIPPLQQLWLVMFIVEKWQLDDASIGNFGEGGVDGEPPMFHVEEYVKRQKNKKECSQPEAESFFTFIVFRIAWIDVPIAWVLWSRCEVAPSSSVDGNCVHGRCL
jgi:hypothetical protein